MIWIIFIFIWVCSCIIHITLTYYENKHVIYTVGDLIDKTEIYMWSPLVNTIVLIVLGIAIMIAIIINILKLSVWWEKFRNIKLK